MAEFTKKSDAPEDDETEAQQRDQLEVRETMRIESLAADEELIGDDMFSSMHEDLASGQSNAKSGRQLPPARKAAPSAPTASTVTPITAPPIETEEEIIELEELVLDVLAPELRTGIDRRHSASSRATEAVRSPSDVAKLEAEIQHAATRQDVAGLALQLARRFAHVSALLIVNRGIITGLAGRGAGLEERIEGVMISVSMGGLFADVCQAGTAMRVQAPFDGVNVKVIGALGRRDAREVLVVPVTIRGRVVGLLYADNGNDPVPMTSIGALNSLGDIIGSAFGRLIMESKR